MKQNVSQNAVLAAMCFAVVVVVASVSSLNVALAELSTDLKAGPSELTWIADAHTVALAALVLPFGALGDRFGRRTVLLIGTAVFGVAAGLGALAGSPETLIAARAVMGVGAAMIMPGTLSTITATLPPDRREQGLADSAGFAGAGAILGMVAAGLLMQSFSWRSTFLVTAVAAAVSFAWSALTSPDTRDPRAPRLDLLGAALAVVMITGLTLGLISGPDRGWANGLTLGAWVVSAGAGTAYVVRSLRIPEPMLDPRLFRRPALSAGAIAIAIQNLVMLGVFIVILQNMQLVLGYSPLKSALGLLPVALMVLPVSAATPLLVARFGLRVTMVAGLVLLAVSQVWLALIDIADGYSSLILANVPFAIGFALATTPATTSIVSSLPLSQQGLASAINDVTREVGAALGIALLGSLFTSTVAHRAGSPVNAAVHTGSVRAFTAAAVVLAVAVVAVAVLGRRTAQALALADDFPPGVGRDDPVGSGDRHDEGRLERRR